MPPRCANLFGQTHYRKQLNFTDDALKASAAGAQRLGELHVRLARLDAGTGTTVASLAEEMERAFREAMDDDLDVPRAIAAIQNFVRDANAALDREGATTAARDRALDIFNAAVGVLQIVPEFRHAKNGDEALWERARELGEDRRKAKYSRDFGKADQIRKALMEIGFEVRDTKDGGFELRRV